MKINIPEVLTHLRAKVVEGKRAKRRVPTAEALAMKAATAVLADPGRLAAAQRAAGLGGRAVARKGVIGPLPGPLHGWTDARDTPAPPTETFRGWWKRTKDQGGTHR
ncbi:lactate utilisation protein LutB domain-containing protein [Streptacidiphilus sp. MAP12-33]|uniref:lactate utilisation protein LutB domain-containing protein n=1 Tax=Streptacidiphilus sp. MAP12-33 TaxID=3156266 RepID=UPI00351649AD